MVDRGSGVRLAELLAALSLAIDLGLGQPMEHVLRSSLIAARLGLHMGFDDQQRADTYYLSLIAWVGCTADSQEAVDPDPAGTRISVTYDLNPRTFWRRHLVVRLREPGLARELRASLAALPLAVRVG